MRRELRACEVLIAFCFFIEIEAYLYQGETLRLVGGSNRYEGRLEILTQRGWGERGRWGTICDNHLNDKLAVVACRSLGLPSNTPEAYGGALYGQGSGPVVWQGFKCNGSESRITSCMLIGLESINGSKQCTHDHDVSINCLPTRVTAVRLYGGENELEGRLEVYKQGRWGTVCDADLNDNLAVVVCRSLGLSWNTSKAYGGAIFGVGSGPIWMDTVNCSGSEANLTECRHRGWGVSDCDHGKDVSINCLPPNEGLVRLVGGPTQYEGRLEVSKFGRWGTVCDDYLNNNLSVVVCRSLGLPWKTSVAYGNAAYGEGSGPIWLNNVICSGSETSIKECKHTGWRSHYCDHSEDVSINCLPPDEGLVRLVGGPTQYEGRLEVSKFGRWGTVCDDYLNNNLSVVVCRSLGLPWKTSEAYRNAAYGEGSGPIWLYNVNCSGSETSITECKHKGRGSHYCWHSEDVSINCLPSDVTAVRLYGGENELEGRLEVYKQGRWGTVCDADLNDNLAVVVCRSLGLSWNTSKAYGGAIFGVGSGPIWMDTVNCSGSEANLTECRHRGWGVSDCDHGKDVSINCLPPNEGLVRLVGGPTQYEGRLEVSKFGRWGTVCDDYLNNNLSVVVCRSLGLPWKTSVAYGNAAYGEGSGPIWLNNVICSGSETSIKECKHTGWRSHYCDHGVDVSINCLPPDEGLVRLVGGPTQYEGRLEVSKFGRWGTVCDDYLNNNLSVVVCRSLGLPWKTSEAYRNAAYGEGSGPIWLYNVNCSGSETSITECKHKGWESHYCWHSEDVSINCLPSDDNAVQLIGGVTDNEGRLQVYKFGRWRSVCFNELDDKLSAVVCRSLDLPW
ncbi:deleted in malignant brain tumors 1 protein-like isoform X2 [Crassostrea angulata]|nr:deleted in malignant brain tumors 1 protein-like isoform X2 [Crassostrea angulata]